MSQGRRNKGEIRYQEVQGTRSHHKKPPFHGNWQPTVPSWKKKFYQSVGLVPWRLMESKNSMHLYKNIVQWNDSACEEAFHNAKRRFWAKINRLPCDISLPDPDMYIDEIDWNSEIDPELYLDLEREPKHPEEKDKGEEVVVILHNYLLQDQNQSFSCSGWGEAEDDLKKAGTAGSYPIYRDFDEKGTTPNPRECFVTPSNGAVTNKGLRNNWKDSDGRKNNCNRWDGYSKEWRQVNESIGGSEWDGNMRNREDVGCYMSRYKTSRFNGNEYQSDRGWRGNNGRGRRRVNFAC